MSSNDGNHIQLIELDQCEPLNEDRESCSEILVHFEKDETSLYKSCGDPNTADVYSYACDDFTCGVCAEHLHYLTSFLWHKSKHALNINAYRCELCNRTMKSQDLLKGHYVEYHKIAMLFNHMETGKGIDTLTVEPSVTKHLEEFEEFQQNPQNVVSHSNITDKALKNSEGNVIQNDIQPQELSKGELLVKRNASHESDQSCNASLITDYIGVRIDDDTNINLSTDNINQRVDPNTNTELVPDYETGQHEQMSSNFVKEMHLEVEQWPEKNGAENMEEASYIRDTEDISPNTPSILNNQTAADKGDDMLSADTQTTKENKPEDIYFLLIKETRSTSAMRPVHTHWYCCLICPNYRSRHRNGFLTHMRTQHHNASPQTVANPHPIEALFEAKNVVEKQILTVKEYDASRPVVGKGAKRRLETQDVKGTYPCPQCDKVFDRLRYLRRHQQIHKKPSVTHACPTCSKVFNSVALLERHILTVHHNITKEFQCKQCNYRSSIKSDIHVHRQLHPSDSVLCHLCGHSYSDKSSLRRHMEVHDPNRPYACSFPECNWRFKSEVMCNAHMRAHTSEGKFKCLHCGKSFRHKHHLQRHDTQFHHMIREKSRDPVMNNMDSSSLTHQLLIVQTTENDINTADEYTSSALDNTIHTDLQHLEKNAHIAGLNQPGVQEKEVEIVSGDLSSLSNLIGMTDVEFELWPP